MTRIRETKAELLGRVEYWKTRYTDAGSANLAEVTLLKEQLSDTKRQKENAEWQFIRARELWNTWIEADKGFDDGLVAREAFATWSKSDFQELLSLLK